MTILVALTALAPAWAAAPTHHFAVLDLKSPPLLVNLGRTVSLAVAAEAGKMGDTAVTSLDIAEKLGANPAKEAIDCGPDPACLIAALKGLKVDRIIAGTFGRDATHYVIHMIHVDVKTGQVVSRLDLNVLIAARELTRDVRQGAPALLQGEPEQTGTLVVASKVEGATVMVDGRAVGQTPKVTVQLQPGKHQVHVEKTDYLPEDRFVEITAKQTTRFVPRLFVVPGKHPGVLVAKAAAPRKKPQAGLPPLRLPAGTWASLGVSVVATGVGVYFGLQARNVERQAIDLNHDGVLDITRKTALAGQQDALLSNVLYATAGAGVIAAAVFAVLAPQPADGQQAKDAATQPTAHLGAAVFPGGGAVTLGGRF